MAADRHRIRYAFWLDIKKSDEEKLSDDIELLKNKRSFAKAIRDGLRLILSLREGSVDVLLELFPFVKEKLQPSPMPSDDDLKRRLDWMEQLLLAQYKGDGGIKMASVGEGRPRTSPPPMTAPIVVEVDTSEAFLNAF